LPKLLAEETDKNGWTQTVNEEGKAVQSLKIEAPTMTEEDQYGYNMPEKYKCDSCRAVMHHIDEAFRKKQPKSRRLKSWEYTDLFEETCRDAFEGYGIKLVNGENVLSGPGLKDEVELSPGMGAIQMGGDSWKKRLAEICRKIVFEHVGEEETYDLLHGKWKAGEALSPKDACMKEVGFCNAGPKMPPKKKTEEKKEKEKKAKKEKKVERKDKAAKSSSAKAEKKEASSSDKMDVQAFLRKLAVKHGLNEDEYLTARSQSDWEKHIVAIAGRIFNRQADEL